jgi:hypothetical protein
VLIFALLALMRRRYRSSVINAAERLNRSADSGDA